jgi:hypothetical protein
MASTIVNPGDFVSPNVKAWADARSGSGVVGLILRAGAIDQIPVDSAGPHRLSSYSAETT